MYTSKLKGLEVVQMGVGVGDVPRQLRLLY
jgi:hypothetical protein